MTATSHPTGKFEGRIWWLDRPENKADHLWLCDVIGTPTKIAFDFPDDGVGTCTVVLKPASGAPPSWTGTWHYSNQSNGPIDVRMYTSVDGGIMLVGTWVQDGNDLDLFIDLSQQVLSADVPDAGSSVA